MLFSVKLITFPPGEPLKDEICVFVSKISLSTKEISDEDSCKDNILSSMLGVIITITIMVTSIIPPAEALLIANLSLYFLI